MAPVGNAPQAMFEGLPAVTKVSLPDQVFFRLREALISGRFAPSQRIPLRTIAAAMGTSTMPAREAVNRLIALGALELLPNRRVSVPTLTADKYQDLAISRVVIEGATAERAMLYLGDDEIAELAAVHAAMRIALQRVGEPDGHSGYLDLNRRFHFLLYSASGSANLIATIENLWLQVGPYLNLNLEKSRDWFTTDQHLPILEAVRRRDAVAVGNAIRTNISFAAEFVISQHRLDELVGDSAEE